MGSISHFIASPDYVLTLPIILLALFAAGLAVVNNMTPPEWNWTHAVTALIGLAFSAAAMVKIFYTQTEAAQLGRRLQVAFQHNMVLDHFAIYFYGLFLGVAALSVLISLGGLDFSEQSAWSYALILISVIGLMLTASGFTLWLQFIGFELALLPAFVSPDGQRRGGFAAISIFFSILFAAGLFWLHRISGGTNLHDVAQGTARFLYTSKAGIWHGGIKWAWFLIAAGLLGNVIASVLARWQSDANNPASAFAAVAAQAAAWACALRLLLWGIYPLHLNYFSALFWIAAITMFLANLIALFRSNVRAALVYCSLAQAASLLLGVAAAASVTSPNPAIYDGVRGVLLYLPVYLVANLGMIGLLRAFRDESDDDDVTGLFRREPAGTVLLLLFFILLAGIPSLPGFYGKYSAFVSLHESVHPRWAIAGIVSTLLSLYVYVRLAITMFKRSSSAQSEDAMLKPPHHAAIRALLIAAALSSILLAIFPHVMTHIANWTLQVG